MSGIEFLSRILGLQGLIIRKNASNRQASLDLSSQQLPNTAVEVNMPYASGTLLLAPDVEGINGQVLKTNGNGTTSWIAIPSAPVTSVNGQTGAVSITPSNIGAISILEKGVANGVASLDSDGTVPYAQLPFLPMPIDFNGSVTSNQTSGTVFSINSVLYRSFIAQVSVFIDDSSDYCETFMILGSNNDSSWTISPSSAGNNSGVTFSISPAGVLSFSDLSARQKTIAYKVQAINNTLESYTRKQEKGYVTSSLASDSLFSADGYRSFMAQVSVFVDDTSDKAETFILIGANNGSNWYMSQVSTGLSSGVTFSISSSGLVSFSGQAGKTKKISYHYEVTDNFTGKIVSDAASGTITSMSITGFRGFTGQVSVFVDGVSALAETFLLIGVNNGVSWSMTVVSAGDNTNSNFSIDGSGVISFSGPLSLKTISYRLEPITI